MADGAIVPSKKHWAAARADELIGRLESATATPKAMVPFVERAGSVAGHLGVAAVVAATLGAADAIIGPEPGGFSTDAGLAVGALLLSVATDGATSEYARTQGVMLSGMFLRRKTAQMVSSRKSGASAAAGKAPPAPATPEEDSPVKKAKEVGL